MIRITFEILPGGDSTRTKTIGIMEIANIKTYEDNSADYMVVMKKQPPYKGALRAAWRKGLVKSDDGEINKLLSGEDEDTLIELVNGHHRAKRGVYDLFYRAMIACGLDKRNKTKD